VPPDWSYFPTTASTSQFDAPEPEPGPAVPPVPLPPTLGRSVPVRGIAVALVLGLAVAGVVLDRQRPAVATAAVYPLSTSVASGADGWTASFVDDAGRPARWDPCRPVHYVVSWGAAPASARPDLAAALTRLEAASGLQFVDDGATTEPPRRSRPAFDRRRWGSAWAPLLIAWAGAAETDIPLSGGRDGVTVAVAVPSATGGGSIVTGQVVINTDLPLPSGFGPGQTEGEVVLHELGHAVGLGHVEDPAQIMYPMTSPGIAEYGAGDQAGLAALGAAAGCHRAPTPRPLQIADPIR
jgi:hypothetical protein